MKKIGYGIEYISLVVVVIAIWQIMNLTGDLNPVILPAPLKVWQTFISLLTQGTLLTNLLISVSRVLKGYVLAMLLGLILGIFIGLFDHLKRITDLLIQIIKPIPPIAWIPLVILWFGIGESGKVFLIFLGGFFTMLVNVVDGIRQADKKLLEVSETVETPFIKHVFRVIIPGAAPNIFTGFRVGLSSCWMCVVAAELVSSNTGLGFMIMNARQFGQTDVVIVGMLIIGLIGKIMDSLLKLIEGRVIKWA
ncbi:sulfonate transport system permease protein [Pseudobutyrivibrio sp. OR37]|uniref:ABC transporter permease n=1 Tax=Pseudobutyrivibrio sp. OR37 TaxID=1798186 RepID=UPI0008DEF176|nr:ABC transporter permease [Pseudobutyrivibrio sp. OR37]SFI13421.1 sulfonate transport system permease protein [Pseudobutyrivibrio sp. OR37]